MSKVPAVRPVTDADLVRFIAEKQYSQPGELVFDPFGGLMTVVYCAIKLGRHGLGIELNARYFADGAAYCAAAERVQQIPTLFDMTGDEVVERGVRR